MIELTDKQLKTLQKIELEMLIEINRICKKNHIHYSLTGGTLLGAVRHGGFIPWDDDADISMLRSEYIRFRKACETDLDHSRFYFQDIETTEGYRWGYGKIRRKDSVFLREHQEDMPYEQGIFIDIFPRDGIPDGIFLSRIHRAACFLLRKALWSEVGKIADKNVVRRFLFRCISIIPRTYLVNCYRKLITWSNRKKTKYVRALTFPLPNNIPGYDCEWYRGYTSIRFEDQKLMVERSYIEWLKREFGDYMKLPPKEKQKVHPISKISFPKEYSI